MKQTELPQIILRIFIWCLRGTGNLWIAFWGLMMIASVAVHLGLLADDSPAVVSLYLSPIWYGFLLLIGMVPLLITFRFRLPLISLCFWVLYFIFLGDHSLWMKADQPSFSQTIDTTKIKVAAINARYYSYGIETVVNGIKKLDADIILLSEHSLDAEKNREFKERIYPMRLYHGKADSTAILSRLPVILFKQADFPTHQASLSKQNDIATMHLNPYRSFSHAVVDINGTNIDVISVRLIAGQAKDLSLIETWRWARYLLHEQKKEIKFFINYIKQLENPVIFGGDLNTPPSSLTGKEFFKIAQDTYLRHHFWGNYTFRGVGPIAFSRLDYLFTVGNIISTDAWIQRLPISDHWPIVAIYAIEHKK